MTIYSQHVLTAAPAMRVAGADPTLAVRRLFGAAAPVEAGQCERDLKECR